MSSNPAESRVDPAGFKSIRKPLKSVSLRGFGSEARSDMKRDASLFLSAEFRNSVRTKSALLNSAANRMQSSTRARVNPQTKVRGVDRWQDEGGR